ncbi:Uncharacterised protein [Candidatus Anstonella stagnisolia]|nr:Uncharacterised protein [Candidatus Anstonella stagnisolia]
MKALMAAVFLLVLASASFAMSCPLTTSLYGNNFSWSSTVQNCTGNITDLLGWTSSYTGPAALAVNSTDIYMNTPYDGTNYFSGNAFTVTLLPTIGNRTMKAIARNDGGGGCGEGSTTTNVTVNGVSSVIYAYTHATGGGASTKVVNVAGNLSISAYNATHYNLSVSGLSQQNDNNGPLTNATLAGSALVPIGTPITLTVQKATYSTGCNPYSQLNFTTMGAGGSTETTPEANVSGGGFYYSDFAQPGGYTYYVRSGFTGSTINRVSPATAAYAKLFLFYAGTTLLTPQITYFPVSDAFGNFYNLSNGAAFVKNNTDTYVFDKQSQLWYLCPAYAATTFTNTYSTACVVLNEGGIQNLNMNIIYLINNCFQSGGNFFWSIKAPTSQSYLSEQILTNGSVVTGSFSGTSVSGNASLVNTANFTIRNLNYGYVCAWTNSTSVFFNGANPIMQANNLTKMGSQIMFFFFVGSSAAVPYASVAMFLFNDIFQVVSVPDMFILFVFSAVVGIVYSYQVLGDKTLKSVGMYVAIALAMLSLIAARGAAAGLTGFPDFSGLQNSIGGLQTSVNSANLFGFAVSAVAFIVNFFVFILALPLIISGYLFGSLQMISWDLYNAVSVFQPIFAFGMYLWVAIKAYEVISNRFRPI